MSSIRLWAGWTFPLCSLRHMKCFFFPVFRPISIHSLSFLLNMSPLILKDVCVHEGLVRQNMYKHMCTCKHASTRDTHADSRVHTQTRTRARAFARRRALIRQTVQRVGVWSFEERTWKRLLCSEQRFVWSRRSARLRGALTRSGTRFWKRLSNKISHLLLSFRTRLALSSIESSPTLLCILWWRARMCCLSPCPWMSPRACVRACVFA